MGNKQDQILFADAFKHFQLKKPFHVMIKPFGSKCNLHCEYCYYLEKKNLYTETPSFKMQDDVLERFIRTYIETQVGEWVQFVWQGGEPTLMGMSFYEKVIRLQNKYKGSKKIENLLQTNGTLITPDWARFLKDNQFLVGVSIDGPEHLHNAYRPYASGKPSFKDIMRSIELFHRYQVDFNTLSVVNDLNVDHPLEVYHFLKSIGSHFQQFIPVVERVAEKKETLNLVSPEYKEKANVTDFSVDPLKYGQFLTRIFDEWVRKDIGSYFIQIFDVALANWYGVPPGLCIFDRTCGSNLVMEHNGDVYSCDHFVYPENLLGNIKQTSFSELLNTPQQIDFGLDKRNKLAPKCQKCKYVFACHGGCPKHRFELSPEGDEHMNYFCDGYYHFFDYIAPVMDFMVDELKHERPPAGAMKAIEIGKLKF